MFPERTITFVSRGPYLRIPDLKPHPIPCMQVRDSAISALTALNVTADVLRQVRGAVAAARHAQAGDITIKDLAVTAMQRALNATAASALAMRITREALGTAASEETSELLTALTRVAQDLEKSDSSSSGGAGGGHKRPSITVSSDEPASAGAAGNVGGAPPAAGVQAAVGSSGAVHVATPAAGAAAGMAAVQADAAKLPSAGGASEVNAVGAAPGAEAQVDSSSGSSSSGSNRNGRSTSGTGSRSTSMVRLPGSTVILPCRALCKSPDNSCWVLLFAQRIRCKSSRSSAQTRLRIRVEQTRVSAFCTAAPRTFHSQRLGLSR